MEDLITIWTPVVISQLIDVQKIREHSVYYLDHLYRGLEDVKIKIRQAEAKILVREVEVIISLDVLVLVQNNNGDLQLVSYEEKRVNHIPVSKFSMPFTREPDLGFRVNIANLNWEGELKGHELKIRYELDYIVLVLQDQAIAIASENSSEKILQAGAGIRPMEDAADPYREEKDELLRKIFCYERDITSLKKSIHKTENQNKVLNRELIRYQQLVDKLQQAIENKDNRRNQIQPQADFSYWRTSPQPIKDHSNLTTRLKRMFITAL